MDNSCLTDPSQRYDCTDCTGYCCRTGYLIIVDEAERNRLLELQAVREVLERKNVGFVKYEIREDSWFLPKELVDGREECAFLNEDKLCHIHAVHGFDAKPKVCKAYPFSYLDEGNGKRLSYSFQCKSIRQNYGHLVSEGIPNEERYLKVQTLPQAYPLLKSGGKSIERGEYLRIWNGVRDAIEGNQDPRTAIIAAIRGIAPDFKEDRFDRSVPVLYSFFWNFGVMVQPLLKAFSDDWFSGFGYCLRQLSLNDDELKAKALNPDFWQTLLVFQKEVPFYPAKDGGSELLNRYFTHIVERKTFIVKSPSLFLALTSLLYCWEFLRMHAKILSISAKEESGITKDTMERVILDVEGNFAYHKLTGENLYREPIETDLLSLLLS